MSTVATPGESGLAACPWGQIHRVVGEQSEARTAALDDGRAARLGQGAAGRRRAGWRGRPALPADAGRRSADTCRCATPADSHRNRRKCSTFGPMLPFQPKPGMLLMCDFDTGFKPPEMVKVRPVVVISPGRKRSRARLCTVVPLSSAAPKPVESFHCRINPQSLPRTLRRRRGSWAKCDMLYTVSVDRLDRVRVKRGGKPTYGTPRVPADVLDAIRRGVIKALGLDVSCKETA